MRFVSIRIITDDVPRLVAFYEQVTGATATWSAEVFAELVFPPFTLAIASSRTVPLFGPGSARAADNRTVITEFLVDDVDAEYDRVKGIRPTSSTSRRRCPGATARCCSATPTAIWSTSSPRSPRRP
jgi:hypothetical protein